MGERQLDIVFLKYSPENQAACLSLFDLNSPEFFAPNERDDYKNFLNSVPRDYELCEKDGKLVGAFGLSSMSSDVGALEWILLNPAVQGSGLGTTIMNRVMEWAMQRGFSQLKIATSHKAYKFFEKKGAVAVSELENGWGPGMHRIDMEVAIDG